MDSSTWRISHSRFFAPKIIALVALFGLFSSACLAQGVRFSPSGDNVNLPSFMLDLVNRNRVDYGSVPVQMNEKLNRVAQAYAEY